MKFKRSEQNVKGVTGEETNESRRGGGGDLETKTS